MSSSEEISRSLEDEMQVVDAGILVNISFTVS